MIIGEEKEWLRDRLLATGACSVGFATAEAVSAEESARFAEWLGRGGNAGMEYMRNYPELRNDPRGLLECAQTVISLAYSYKPEVYRSEEKGVIAAYAYGKDYHKELRKLLKPALREIGGRFPDAGFRICIDSAPVHERYWAVKSGIGFRGDNGCVIVPGFGSMVFLVEILTTLEIEPNKPLNRDCGHCGACSRACPGQALHDGVIDCRRCISYLTIEHRGDWDEIGKEVMVAQGERVTILGCDVCQRVCPHNCTAPPTDIEAFRPSPMIMALTPEDIADLTDMDLAGTSLNRVGIEGLMRNVNFGLAPSQSGVREMDILR